MYFRKLYVITRISIVRYKTLTTDIKVELPASFANANEEYKPGRDKCRLREQHKNVLLETTPYDEAHSWIHLTEKYQRSLYGRLGAKSKVNPQICFASKADNASNHKLKGITQPETLQQVLEKIRDEKAAKLQAINDREGSIVKKLEKLEQWTADLNAKIEKRKSDAAAAILRKERLIDEVRRHFGFKVDLRDERFKEMVEQKEKEDKRKQKEAKRKLKEEKMMAKLVKQSL